MHYYRRPIISPYSSSSFRPSSARRDTITVRLRIWVVLTFVAVVCLAAETGAAQNRSVPSVIVFGDSIVDPGNNNKLKSVVKCDFLPYGRDFMGGLPTGRFSNGKVPTDLIAQAFGVKELLPAYLDPKLTVEDLLTGVSFASGGSGYDPLTSKLVSVISLSQQLELFKEYVGKLNAAVGEERVATILSKSLFLVCAGSDDIANTYFSSPARKLEYDVPSYTDLMLSSASTFVQDLYSMGARKIGVLSAPPIGCVPSQRTLGGGILRGCAEPRNEAALLFNSKISSHMSTSLRPQLSDAKLVFLDVYSPLLDIIQNPAQYGFEVANKGCCGTGDIEVTVLCNHYTTVACADASKYVFWDSYHPTEAAYQLLVDQVLKKYYNDFF